MKRNERTIYNSLKKTVTADTIYVEIPTAWTHEARQAIHELLTVSKRMRAEFGQELLDMYGKRTEYKVITAKAKKASATA